MFLWLDHGAQIFGEVLHGCFVKVFLGWDEHVNQWPFSNRLLTVMWLGLIQSGKGLNRPKTDLPPSKKQFCQHTSAFGVELQLFTESPAHWPTLLMYPRQWILPNTLFSFVPLLPFASFLPCFLSICCSLVFFMPLFLYLLLSWSWGLCFPDYLGHIIY